MVVLPESAKHRLGHLLDLLLTEGSPVESSLGRFLPQRVAVLSLEDKEETLLVGAVSAAGEVVVGA